MRFFFFGSLRDPDVLAAVLDRAVALGQDAWLEGYRLAPVLGEHYPALVAAPAERVEGIIVEGLDAKDAAKLAFYEGDEYFTSPQTIVTFAGAKVRALAFVARAPLALAAENWDFQTWRRAHKVEFLGRARRWMTQYPSGSLAEAERDWSRDARS